MTSTILMTDACADAGFLRSNVLRCNLEWRTVDFAASLYGKVLVPLYDNLGPDPVGASDPVSLAGFRTLTLM